MNDSTTAAWRDLLLATQALQALLDQGDWDQFELAMKNRDRRLRTLTQQSVPADEAAAVRELIEAIAACNQTLESQAKTLRDEALNKLRSADKGTRMKAAYGKANRPF